MGNSGVKETSSSGGCSIRTQMESCVAFPLTPRSRPARKDLWLNVIQRSARKAAKNTKKGRHTARFCDSVICIFSSLRSCALPPSRFSGPCADRSTFRPGNMRRHPTQQFAETVPRSRRQRSTPDFARRSPMGADVPPPRERVTGRGGSRPRSGCVDIVTLRRWRP